MAIEDCIGRRALTLIFLNSYRLPVVRKAHSPPYIFLGFEVGEVGCRLLQRVAIASSSGKAVVTELFFPAKAQSRLDLTAETHYMVNEHNDAEFVFRNRLYSFEVNLAPASFCVGSTMLCHRRPARIMEFANALELLSLPPMSNR